MAGARVVLSGIACATFYLIAALHVQIRKRLFVELQLLDLHFSGRRRGGLFFGLFVFHAVFLSFG
jgi:hypothetical protein